MTAVAELIQFIKANPGETNSAALADRFGLDATIVDAVLAKSAPRVVKTSSRANWQSIGQSLVRAWLWATHSPILWLVVTSVLSMALLKASGPVLSMMGKDAGKRAAMVLWPTILFLTPLVQLCGVSRFAKYRYVVAGAGIYLVANVVTLVFLSSATTSEARLLVLTMCALSSMYLVTGVPVMIVSAYNRVRRERRAYEHMTRQQVLERLLQVRQALETAKQVAAKPLSQAERLVKKLESAAPLISLFVAFTTSVVMSAIMLQTDPGRRFVNPSMDSAETTKRFEAMAPMLVFVIGLSIFVYASQFLVGVLSRSGRHLVVTVLMYAVGYVVAAALPSAYVPFGTYGRIGWGNYGIGVALQGLMIVVGYLARVIYQYTVLAERRRSNDPVALAEELVELEWRLVPTSGAIAVMSVDVVGSTAMKKNADPLVAEWTFREYQTWLQTVCSRLGGNVRSTAGDGAILSFIDPKSALDAATALHAEIAEFNKDKNRLPEKFQLRVGVHCGEVQGDLGDVQFTRVIDVAAHIESAAPRGGTAVSETVVEKVGIAGFQKSATSIDGHDVFIYSATV